VKILHVVGARPNFPKLAPVYRAAAASGIEQLIVHTGQHYDESLSADFFKDLEIPSPTLNLGVGSGSHAVQTGRIMEAIEPVMTSHIPDWVLVYGDVNSTAAATLVAVKLGLRVAHVEAGLRSGDRSMPEEINRIVTDSIADLLLTPSRDASAALCREGIAAERIVFVGNVMIDSLFHALPKARAINADRRTRVGAQDVLVTLHRPSNVDDSQRFGAITKTLQLIGRECRVIFAMHPRAERRIREFALATDGIDLIPALSYLDMVVSMDSCRCVITDSGGIQEETTALGVPCFTVRDTTERPITIEEGTNTLVRDLAELPAMVRSARKTRVLRRPENWDGKAGERIVAALAKRQHAGTPAPLPNECPL
jgi:UDP-N-acetylglucosamine 2-epimerase (non-hydrolysing)